jgi:geranylgeranyl pyrophosphate synthase
MYLNYVYIHVYIGGACPKQKRLAEITEMIMYMYILCVYIYMYIYTCIHIYVYMFMFIFMNNRIYPYIGGACPKQKRLAEITEMIHTASLFHDDVIDKAATRRGIHFF